MQSLDRNQSTCDCPSLTEGNPLAQVLLTATMQHHLHINFNWKESRLIAPYVYVNNFVIFSNEEDGLLATLNKISQLLEPTGLRLQSDFQINNLRDGCETEVLGLRVFASSDVLEISPGESCYEEIRANLKILKLHPNLHETQQRYLNEFVRSAGHIYLTMGDNDSAICLENLLMNSEVSDLFDHFLQN